MSVAVTAKRDATRPELADPHILSMTGWLMAGWLAGQSVGRVGSRALPTGTCASRLFVPPRIRVLLASPPPPLVPSFTLIPTRLTGACYSFSRVESHDEQEAFFLPGTAGHRRSRRHRRRYHATVSNRLATGYVRSMDGERARQREKRREKKKERTAKRLEAGRRSRDSRAIELKGARAKERERKKEKGRIGWGGAFQSRSEAPRVPTTIEKGETCRRGYRRGQ